LTAAAARVLVSSCHDCTLHLATPRPPLLVGDCRFVKLAPFNTRYEHQGIIPQCLACPAAPSQGVGPEEGPAGGSKAAGKAGGKAAGPASLFPLPPAYERALHKKLSMTTELRHRFRQAGLSKEREAELNNTIQSYFKKCPSYE
ncbi:C-CAP/cofactor C-like domain-containing protein, partial [Haematococcus lacustris]